MNSAPLLVIVYGNPAPQGSKRHVGGGRMVESSATLKDWRHDITLATRDAMQDRLPLEGPVNVWLEFSVKRPVSTPRKVLFPVKRPDVDKLARGVLDALDAAGVFGDDSQVVDLHAIKRFAGSDDALPIPGVRITVTTRHVLDLHFA